jgi:hypothetical protein
MVNSEILLDGYIQEITQAYSKFLERCLMSRKLAKGIIQTIENTNTYLNFFSTLSNRLSDLLNELNDIVVKLHPFSQSNTFTKYTDENEINGRYTMEKERTIHHKHFLDSAGSTDSDEQSEKVEDDLGSNVELF